MIGIDLSLSFIVNSDSLGEWNILEREEKQQKIKQSIIKTRFSVFQYFDYSNFPAYHTDIVYFQFFSVKMYFT